MVSRAAIDWIAKGSMYLLLLSGCSESERPNDPTVEGGSGDVAEEVDGGPSPEVEVMPEGGSEALTDFPARRISRAVLR